MKFEPGQLVIVRRFSDRCSAEIVADLGGPHVTVRYKDGTRSAVKRSRVQPLPEAKRAPLPDADEPVRTVRTSAESVAQPKPHTVRSERHLRFVRSCPCVACVADGLDGYAYDRDPHHFDGRDEGYTRGTALKVSDLITAPLCRPHHDQFHAHGRFLFCTREETLNLMWRGAAVALAKHLEVLLAVGGSR